MAARWLLPGALRVARPSLGPLGAPGARCGRAMGLGGAARRGGGVAAARLLSGGGAAKVIRNVAIVAHVDHGKTTLVDALLQASTTKTAVNESGNTMDSNDLERERGITILSKSTSMTYGDALINIVDTPGHSDFGGEVERVLSMVDGICVVVDGTDGPMPQTKFVLSKALELNLTPIVVINKIDRPTARLDQVENEVFDLFCSLNASDAQLDYKTVWAIGKLGWSSLTLPPAGELAKVGRDMKPLLDTIVSTIPAPRTEAGGFRFLVSIMESDPGVHLGKLLLTGRVVSGSVAPGDRVVVMNPDGTRVGDTTAVIKIFKRVGLQRFEVPHAEAGDIVTLAGVLGGRVADTICAPEEEARGPLRGPVLDPPTISMFFSINDSPLAGHKEYSGGNKLTTQQLKQRLLKETESNIAIQVLDARAVDGRDCYEVMGRGEMQLGILIENMRREGFELAVSPPKAILKKSADGELQEPLEEVTIDVAEAHAGMVLEALMARKADLIDSVPSDDGTRRRGIFKIPTRGSVGLRSEMIRKTRGDVIMNLRFLGYEKYRGKIADTRRGVLVSMDTGTSTNYALDLLQERGELFIGTSEQVYSGMIIGECARDNDMEVNPTKQKKLTNIRTTSKEENVRLTPPRQFQLEDLLGYLADDELLEVTPLKLRLRKSILQGNRRQAIARAGKAA